MLVLVLILVVIAMVLLVAGWLLPLVALAWTSVGISILAGLVLIYDGWQTRSAVRAGRQRAVGRGEDEDGPVTRGSLAPGGERTTAVGAVEAGTARVPAEGFAGADMEPATQVLPIVPPRSGAPGTPNASEETVVLPAVQPSGSPEAPSGASRSSGFQSRSVTGSGSRPADRAPVEGSAAPVEPASPEHPAGRPGVADGGTTTAGPAGVAEQAGGVDAVSGNAGNGSSAGARDAGTEVAGAARGPSGRAAGSTGQAGDVAGATTSLATGSAASGTADRSLAAEGDEPTSMAGAVGGHGPDVEDRTRAVDAVDAGGVGNAAGAEDPSGETPEEPRDPAYASLVARLPDEVVVIDEHPRYHVQGCPLLPGQPVIALPVSEAVELGFTPCGLCSPNRTLGERHPAEVR